MSNVSRLDPKSPSRSPGRSPVPSIYAGQTGAVASGRTWQTEIKSAFIPFDLDEFQEGGIGTKIIACLMSPLFILSKFTAPVLDEENLDLSWNKVNLQPSKIFFLIKFCATGIQPALKYDHLVAVI